MTHRRKRVESEIHRIMSRALQEGDESGGAVAPWKISVTRVSVTPDLHHARVFFSHLEGEAGREEAELYFRENQPQLRRFMAAHLRLRRQPSLQFTWDLEFLEAERVDRIIAGLENSPGKKEPENRG